MGTIDPTFVLFAVLFAVVGFVGALLALVFLKREKQNNKHYLLFGIFGGVIGGFAYNIVSMDIDRLTSLFNSVGLFGVIIASLIGFDKILHNIVSAFAVGFISALSLNVLRKINKIPNDSHHS